MSGFRLSKRIVGAVIVVVAVSCAATTDWGFGAIIGMTTPPDRQVDCRKVTIQAEQKAAERKACSYQQGSLASDSLGVAAEALGNIPIQHVIVLMKENRSFDHVLGKLAERGQPGVDGIDPGFANSDNDGKAVHFERATSTCLLDPGHQADAMQRSINHGAMDGFVKNAADTTSGPVKTDGHYVMSYYDESDLPFYYWLAKTFAVSDRHFAPLQSGTFSSRNFFMFGSNQGVVSTGITYPNKDQPSILRTLMDKGFTWGAYTDPTPVNGNPSLIGEPFSGTLGMRPDSPGVHSFDDFLAALDKGTLPNVAFVDGVENYSDDHPTADLQVGEKWVRNIYDHAMKSPQWKSLAIVFTYDEGGGFADHVNPEQFGPACQAAPTNSPYTLLGVRVPLVVISPWARRNYASHVVHDHTAITRFIEAIFGLPALTARDANADALLDMFDFTCGHDLMPVPDAPPAGTGGCVDQPPYTG